MNSYTASNGVGLTITRDRAVRWRPGIPPDLVSSALRDYFQAERDEELGRWRDPKKPDMVCFPVVGDLDAVWVVYEGTGLAYMRERDQAFYAGNAFSEVAQRYFDTHPKPKPWDAAQPGEFWILTVDEKTDPYKIWTDTQRVRRFERVERPYTTICLNDPRITAGHRVWPEEDK